MRWSCTLGTNLHVLQGTSPAAARAHCAHSSHQPPSRTANHAASPPAASRAEPFRCPPSEGGINELHRHKEPTNLCLRNPSGKPGFHAASGCVGSVGQRDHWVALPRKKWPLRLALRRSRVIADAHLQEFKCPASRSPLTLEVGQSNG
jgi:hypothetical protein